MCSLVEGETKPFLVFQANTFVSLINDEAETIFLPYVFLTPYISHLHNFGRFFWTYLQNDTAEQNRPLLYGFPTKFFSCDTLQNDIQQLFFLFVSRLRAK